ncbi:tensin-4-like [Synchiropus picturatus]
MKLKEDLITRRTQSRIPSGNVMPAAEVMSHTVPNHVLRVGQTVCLNTAVAEDERSNREDVDLDISLNNLNKLILEMDPTFEPIHVNKRPSDSDSPTDEFDHRSGVQLVPRGCSPGPTVLTSPCIPIPTPSCSPHGTVVFSGSPSSTLPPLPCGSSPRRRTSSRNEVSYSQGCLLPSHSNRNSAASLLSMSTCSDTSYILGSTLSLASEDADSPESLIACMSGAFSDGSRQRYSGLSPDKPSLTRQEHLKEPTSTQSSPASLAGSLTDIPVLLVNGAPQLDLHIEPEPEQPQTSPRRYKGQFSGSQPSMKFVMDSSKYWFRPNISRAEAEALVKDKEAGTFVVRDSTSYRGSFGLAMKVEQIPTDSSVTAYPGESSSDLVRHFLIESSAKGVRIKGSSREPYFGSLSALVYQHTISAFALPCKLLLQSHDETTGGESSNHSAAENTATASNFIYLNAVPTEMLTGPCAVQKAVTSTLLKQSGSFTPTIVNMKVSVKGVTLTDINRKLFFRRHYPAHLLSHGGEDPGKRLWRKGTNFDSRLFGFVAKGVEANMENVCHVFAEYDPLQPLDSVVKHFKKL